MSAATGRPCGKEKIVEFDRRTSSSHCLFSTLWKRLRTCHKTHYATNGRAIKAGKLSFHNDSMFSVRFNRNRMTTDVSIQMPDRMISAVHTPLLDTNNSSPREVCPFHHVTTPLVSLKFGLFVVKKILSLAKYTTLWRIYYLV